jgi:multidrug efflux pump subunit AcrB
MSDGKFNLSALAVRERSITLFLIILITVAGVLSFSNWGARKTRRLPSSR